MLHPLIRFTFALLIISILSVFTARVIGDAQPPHAWLTWEGADHRTPIDVFISDGRRNVNLTYTPRAADAKPIWSADGRLAWIASGDLFVWDGGQIHKVTHYQADREFAYTEMPIAWSADGRLAWITIRIMGRTLSVWDGEQIQVVSEFPSEYYTPFMWTAAGDLVWYAPSVEGWMIQVWDGEGVRVIEELADENQLWLDSEAPVWVSHEGGHPSMRMWDGTQVITLQDGGMWGSKYAWSADGRLAWIDDHGQINLWDGERVRSVPPLENTQTVPEFPLVWSPDGRLTWIARDNLTSQLVIAAWAGETSFQLVESAGDSVYPTWSADGRLAWVTSRYPHADQAHVWDGTTTASFALPGVSLDAPIWSADGRLVFVTEAPYGGQGSILVWEEAALVPLGLTNSPYPDLHWSPPMN